MILSQCIHYMENILFQFQSDYIITYTLTENLLQYLEKGEFLH